MEDGRREALGQKWGGGGWNEERGWASKKKRSRPYVRMKIITQGETRVQGGDGEKKNCYCTSFVKKKTGEGGD